MTRIETLLAEMKGLIKDSLTNESTQEEIQKVAGMDKKLDEILEETTKLQKDHADLKDLYIKQVKNTGFKPEPEDDSDAKGIDQILAEELNKIK